MRHYFSCILLIMLSCKTSKPIINETKPEDEIVGCILSKLPKTIDYKNLMENYTSIYKDTIFEIESEKSGMNEYSVKIDLKASEYYLWLLKENVKGVDSLLIYCITDLKSVDSNFVLDNCEMEIETTEFDVNGNPIASITKTIKI